MQIRMTDLVGNFVAAVAMGTATATALDLSNRNENQLPGLLIASVYGIGFAVLLASNTQHNLNEREKVNAEEQNRKVTRLEAAIQSPHDHQMGAYYTFLLAQVRMHPNYKEAVDEAYDNMSSEHQRSPLIATELPTGEYPANSRALRYLIVEIENNKILKNDPAIMNTISLIKDFQKR